MVGANYPLTVSTTRTTPVSAFLLMDLAPPQNVPFGNGIAYVRTDGSASLVGSAPGLVAGATVTFTSINLPGPAFLYHGLVFQACAIDNQNAFLVSNGLLTRLGNQ